MINTSEQYTHIHIRVQPELKMKVEDTVINIKRHMMRSESITAFVTRAILKEIEHQEHLMNAKRNHAYEESRRRYMEEEKEWDE